MEPVPEGQEKDVSPRQEKSEKGQVKEEKGGERKIQ